MNQRSYLDYNATAPLRDEVRTDVIDALSLDGNPSSVHEEGRRARAAVEAARGKVARLVGAPAESVIFTRATVGACWFRRWSILPCSLPPMRRVSQSQATV